MKDATRAVIGGRDPASHAGTVNPPIYNASTILFPTYEALLASRRIRPGDGMTYGVHGTPSTYGFERALASLEAGPTADEGAYRTRLC
ncbi:MAG: cystathionine beta-lyase, partial [Pseudomonadota bacterium]